jgi:hypothetical protein
MQKSKTPRSMVTAKKAHSNPSLLLLKWNFTQKSPETTFKTVKVDAKKPVRTSDAFKRPRGGIGQPPSSNKIKFLTSNILTNRDQMLHRISKPVTIPNKTLHFLVFLF